MWKHRYQLPKTGTQKSLLTFAQSLVVSSVAIGAAARIASLCVLAHLERPDARVSFLLTLVDVSAIGFGLCVEVARVTFTHVRPECVLTSGATFAISRVFCAFVNVCKTIY